MKRDRMTADEAIGILFGDDWDGDPGASWRSGADIADSVAGHFGFTPEDYAAAHARAERRREVEEIDAQLPDETPLVCPSCGGSTFTAWAMTDTAYAGSRAIIEGGERVEDDAGVYSSTPGEMIEETSQYGCGGCGALLDPYDLAPASPAIREETPDAVGV